MSDDGVNVYRGDYIESVHRLHIAVVNNKGELIYSLGDPKRMFFARSAMKPLQAVPLIETGAGEAFNFDKADIALACASHNGEKIHRSRVLAILDRLGLTKDALQCGTHIPRDIESYKDLIKSGQELTPEFCNCSGKHAGMLATAIHLGEEIENYYLLNHPVQQRVLDIISELLDFSKEKINIGIDGCGVPVHMMPICIAAKGFAYLADPHAVTNKRYSTALKIIRDSMIAHPEMVAGKDRFNTDVMKAFKGRIVSKSGAEGVQCAGDVERGIGIAIKTEDGNGRAAIVAIMEVFKQLGIGNDKIYGELVEYIEKPIKNHRKEIIGTIKPSFELLKV